MKRSLTKRRVIGTVGFAVAATMLAAACGGDDGGSGGSGGTPTAGGTIYVLTQSEGFAHLDPQRNYTGADLAFAGSTLQRTLTTYKYAAGEEGSDITADLATDIGTSSEDAKTWSFTLREGITYEDGSAITCEDVAYGVSRTFAVDVITDGPTYAISYLDIPEDAESLNGTTYPGPYTATPEQQADFDKAVSCDGNTITFNLKVPVADFNYTVTLLSFSPVPKAADTGEAYTTAPVSSGPYKIETYEEGQQLVLVRNENWSKDSDPVRNAYPDSIVVQFGLDPAVVDERLIADAGDDQFAVAADGIQPENLPTIFDDERFADRRQDGFDPYVTYTNVNNSTIDCYEVRLAMYLALDREALRTAGGGPYTGEFADGFIKPNLAPDYAPTKLPEGLNEDGTPNVEAAQAAMDAAAETCPDVVEYVKAGIGFMHPDTPTWQKNVSIWIESLGEIGIKVNSLAVEPSKYYPTVMNPETEWDISRAGWGPDWANASTVIPELFATGGGFTLTRNDANPDQAEFDALVDAAKAETDREAQAKLWQELNQYVLDRLWAIPGSFTKAQDIWGSKVGNAYRWAPFGSFNFGDLYVIQ
jgi:peptide/nickel transport system substrate-binding protein